jgi:hypothetical protein
MSITTNTGWMTKVDPENPAVGEVVNDKLYGAFVILNAVLVADVRPVLDAVRVRLVAQAFP